MVNFLVIEARLTHRDKVMIFPGDLLLEFHLWHVLSACMWGWKMVQILEAVLMGFMSGKGRPLHLLFEVDETRRAWLNLRLVIWADCAEVERIKSMLVTSSSPTLLALKLRCIPHRVEPSTTALNIICIHLRKELLLVPHLVEHPRTSFSTEWFLVNLFCLWCLQVKICNGFRFLGMASSLLPTRASANPAHRILDLP